MKKNFKLAKKIYIAIFEPQYYSSLGAIWGQLVKPIGLDVSDNTFPSAKMGVSRWAVWSWYTIFLRGVRWWDYQHSG
jgi:hypothetical protein